MGQADFRAFEQYARAMTGSEPSAVTVIPRTEPGPSKNFMHVDMMLYSDATKEEQDRYAQQVVDQVREAGAPEDIVALFRSDMTLAQGGRIYDNEGGGVSFTERGLMMTDQRSMIQEQDIAKIMRAETRDIDFEQNNFSRQRVSLHEAAHTMMGLKEPGSDFVAAAIMLRDHPESREELRTTADMRLVYGLQGGPLAAAKYGVECHDAIERALSMTPEQLRSASIETLHAIGSEYDQKNEVNLGLREQSSEGRAIETISQYTGYGMYGSLIKKSWDAAATGMDDDGAPEGTLTAMERLRMAAATPDQMVTALKNSGSTDPEDRRIATALEQSVGRLKTYLAPPETEVAPTPEAAPPQPAQRIVQQQPATP